MQDNTFGPRRGVVCRLRSAPRVLGVAALAVPVVAGLGVAHGLPAAAGGHRAATTASAADTVRLASSVGETVDAPRPAASASARRQSSLQDETGEEQAGAGRHGAGRRHGEDDGERGKDHGKEHGKKHGTRDGSDHDGKALPQATPQEAFRAWFEAGYGYEDAVALSALWHRADIEDVKFLAGRKLLAGRTLPVAPSYPPATAEDKAISAFFDAGYDTADAELLATLYGVPGDLSQAKVTAGSKLLAGGTLPVEPGQTAWSVSDDAARLAYFNNGYDYDDAVLLAQVWSLADPWDAKANAGHKLLDGLPLPLAG